MFLSSPTNRSAWRVARAVLLALSGLALFASTGSAQQASPTPKKDPFSDFHSSLDERGGRTAKSTSFDDFFKKPPPSPTTAGERQAVARPMVGGLKLNGRWDAPLGLSRGGPSGQRAELRALLNGFAQPGKDTGPSPGKHIFGPVTYLMAVAAAETQLGVAGRLASGGTTAAVGFPDGLKFKEFTPEAGRGYTVRLIKDAADQTVALEFVALDARALPRPPDPLPIDPAHKHALQGATYDFVPEGITALPGSYPQVAWDMRDYVLISTRGGPKAADFYIPKPMVSLMLYCLTNLP